MNCILLKITNTIKSGFDKNQLISLFNIKKNYVTCQLVIIITRLLHDKYFFLLIFTVSIIFVCILQ